MLSCTVADATPRVLLERPQRHPHSAGGGLAGLQLGGAGRCSPAGLERRAWLGRLRRALGRGELVLHYQPIVSLRDGRVSHHEALVRLSDGPHGRLLAPASFLPAAERYGLIGDIDRTVLAKVAAVLADQRCSEGAVSEARIAVNLSALSVSDARMLPYIERLLARHGVSPSRLVIELTETASISDMRQAQAFCAGAQALGCAVALDDFGTGFGALHYLKQLSFSYLKIDGGFISGLPRSRHDQLVVGALVGLARGLGFSTIAEFVRDRPTLELLRELGVDYAQGYHLGRPRPGFRSSALGA
jgi:EAL domain-containing protein (putative c-di-GMP-specific phosphodiesterase class I)